MQGDDKVTPTSQVPRPSTWRHLEQLLLKSSILSNNWLKLELEQEVKLYKSGFEEASLHLKSGERPDNGRRRDEGKI